MLLLAGCAGAEQGDAVSQESSKAPEAPANRVGASPVPSRQQRSRWTAPRARKRGFSLRNAQWQASAVCAPPAGPAQYRFGTRSPNWSCVAGNGPARCIRAGAKRRSPLPMVTRATSCSAGCADQFRGGRAELSGISDGVLIMRDDELVAVRPCAGGQADNRCTMPPSGSLRRRMNCSPTRPCGRIPIGRGSPSCWLCERPLGRRVGSTPRAQGEEGPRDRARHPICHRAIHANFTNAQLARIGADRGALLADEALARFVEWVADKPPDFHARRASRADQSASRCSK